MSPTRRSTRPARSPPVTQDPHGTPAEGPAPRLPHERDQSADGQVAADPGQREVGQQALDDLESGQTDTGTKPVTDAVYDRLKKPAN